ncbi:MAG: pyridoxamine 5'-phosphate oxidase family protein [Nitriliruptor sp.]|uniref:pyridoxamine 5'-phosphate oxidase family protein n=1 Tax=Nitriliruptor sp. TaxID=2448056 RepID=UPI00349FFD8D
MGETVARDRNGLEVLSYEECLELLGARRVGRIALVNAGSPVIVPVNYVLDGTSVVIRSAPGAKLDGADRSRPVAFEIDEHDPESRTGWSVLVTGLAEPLEEPDEVERFDRELDAWALGDRDDVHLLRVRAESITGRRLDVPAAPRGG